MSIPGIELDPVLGVTAGAAFGLLGISLVLTFLRLLKGPTLPDRVVALDMIAYQAIGFIALYTAVTRQQSFLDAALILALIAFLATVSFARYVERSRGGGT